MTNNSGLGRFVLPVLALAVVTGFLLVPGALAQNTTNGDVQAMSDTDTRPYDNHDFSGFWVRDPQFYGHPACPECRDRGGLPSYGFKGETPPRTAEGEKRLMENTPTKGYPPNSARAKENMHIDVAYRRSVAPPESTDPEQLCEPLGLMRLLTFSGGNPPMHVIQTDEIIIQRFEWFWDHREVWTDGRTLPNVDDYLLRFNGYSAGEWEGDTLVVTTVGLDDRQWVDAFGFPISDQARLVERWSRPTPNRLVLDMTLTDPVMYTRPWDSSTKVWGLIPKEATEIGGWAGILEDRCVPSDNNYFRSLEPEPVDFN